MLHEEETKATEPNFGSSDIKQVAWYNGVVYNPNTPAITGVFAGPRAGSSKEVATLRSNRWAYTT